MLLSVWGIVIATRRKLRCAPVAATLAVFVVLHLVFRGEIRNRQYLTPMLYVFGGLAVSGAAIRRD
jgi:hypothetical protein